MWLEIKTVKIKKASSLPDTSNQQQVKIIFFAVKSPIGCGII